MTTGKECTIFVSWCCCCWGFFLSPDYIANFSVSESICFLAIIRPNAFAANHSCKQHQTILSKAINREYCASLLTLPDLWYLVLLFLFVLNILVSQWIKMSTIVDRLLTSLYIMSPSVEVTKKKKKSNKPLFMWSGVLFLNVGSKIKVMSEKWNTKSTGTRKLYLMRGEYL